MCLLSFPENEFYLLKAGTVIWPYVTWKSTCAPPVFENISISLYWVFFSGHTWILVEKRELFNGSRRNVSLKCVTNFWCKNIVLCGRWWRLGSFNICVFKISDATQIKHSFIWKDDEGCAVSIIDSPAPRDLFKSQYVTPFAKPWLRVNFKNVDFW